MAFPLHLATSAVKGKVSQENGGVPLSALDAAEGCSVRTRSAVCAPQSVSALPGLAQVRLTHH